MVHGNRKDLFRTPLAIGRKSKMTSFLNTMGYYFPLRHVSNGTCVRKNLCVLSLFLALGAVASAQNFAYVANAGSDSVTVINTAAFPPVETIATESGAHTLAWDPTGKTLSVFCPGSSGVALYTDREG